MSSKPTGKVLCLHGFVQNADLFKAKSSGFRKSLKKIGLESYYLNAPVKIVPADLPFDLTDERLKKLGTDSKEQEFRGWWLRDKEHFKLDAALETIRQACRDEGPFVGLIGFSQGAALAGLISQRFNEFFPENPPLKFSIFFSGFKVEDNESFQPYYEPKIAIPTLHVIGELDTLVSLERSMKLPDECCEKGSVTILKHPGGHFVPNSRNIVDKITSWVLNSLRDPVDSQSEESEKEKKGAKVEEKKDEVDDILSMIENLGKS